MIKPITIKDVAKEAGVSIATVSYVLNGRDDQKISERTRRKVLQIVALLNYTPNGNAKAMRSTLTGNITVLAVCPNALYRAETMHMLDALSAIARRRGRKLAYGTYTHAEAIANADAAICINFPIADFKALGEENIIPLIMADGYTDEPWCFQVNADYSLIRGDGRLAVLNPGNEALRKRILSVCPDAVMVSRLTDLNDVSDMLFTRQRTLHELFKQIGRHIVYADEHFNARMDVLFDCVDKALSHATYENHSFEV